MMRAYDEPDAVYGLAARAVQISHDRLSYRFLMPGRNETARLAPAYRGSVWNPSNVRWNPGNDQ
jgi:hypothetical protein